jgi:hypothetical protein
MELGVPEPGDLVGAVVRSKLAPYWKAGDPIHLGRRTLRVVDVRASEDPEENAVLINSEQVA